MTNKQCQLVTVCLDQVLLFNPALPPMESTSDEILLLEDPRCDAILQFRLPMNYLGRNRAIQLTVSMY